MKELIRRFHVKYLKFRSAGGDKFPPLGRVLIVAPHPDDEVIGCGGLMTRFVNLNNVPHIIIMTGGEGSHRGCCNISAEEIRDARSKLTNDALAVIGVPQDHIHELDFPDGGIDAKHNQVEVLKNVIREISPDFVFIPHWGEGWPDHVHTAEIVKSILPKTTHIYEYCVWMWYYNVWRGLDWKNAYKLYMTNEEHSKKLQAIDAYVTPLAPCGKPWSGVLPKIFLDANKDKIELYFKCGNSR